MAGVGKDALNTGWDLYNSMKILIICMLCLLPAPAFPGMCAAATDSGAKAADGWVIMPAGARPTYMGIHGGTMPVSLLVSDDGSSLLTFVGRTGNDFLDVLRRTDVRMPSLLNATAARDTAGGGLLTGGTVLMAGSAASSRSRKRCAPAATRSSSSPVNVTVMRSAKGGQPRNCRSGSSSV